MLKTNLVSPPPLPPPVEAADGATDAGPTISQFTASRFVTASLAVLTLEHEAVDLSLLMDSGLLGLTQTIIRLTSKRMCARTCVDCVCSYAV